MAQTKQDNTPATNNNAAQLKKFQEETVNKVLDQVNQFQEMGALDLPDNYSPANALKASWFTLLNTQTKDKRPVLEACSKTSIVNALMEMVTQGLNPAKKQCAFIAYGSNLTMQREYFGSIALAKRYNPDIKNITGNAIYEGDKFKYKIDPETGRKVLVSHEQDIGNLDNNLIGAYATILFNDGTSYIEPMTMKMIHAAWGQGATNGNSPAHKNFSDQMSIKTAINRACKPYINASNDSEITKGKSSSDYVPKEANKKELDFVEDGEAEEVREKKEAQEPETEKRPESEEKREQKFDPLKVKNLNEARLLLEDAGVHPAAIEGDKVYEVAKDNGFEIILEQKKTPDPGF